MLPDPTFTFTIPSTYDNIALDCRIYNPPHSVLSSGQLAWHARGAIVAHPYAPMGGSYDDAVVQSVAAEILREGFVVGTFNFRGAGASGGRTSWQAKPELGDYISFAGFFIQYVECLRVSTLLPPSLAVPDSTLLPAPSVRTSSSSLSDDRCRGMILILGGYSYGSLITTHLPPTEEILHRFEKVSKGSAESEIRLRAVNLAAQWNRDAEIYREVQCRSKTGFHEKLQSSPRIMAVAVGGDESNTSSRRPSNEGRKSLNAVGKSTNRSRRKLGSRQHSHSSNATDHAAAEEDFIEVKIPLPITCYLLVSPLLAPVSTLATMFSSFRSNRSSYCEEKLVCNPTLAIYGGDDFFTSLRKLRKWAESLKMVWGSSFRYQEISGAGHFWREDNSDSQMKKCLKEWLLGISSLRSDVE